ncbi:MAG: hypothetical protein AAFQ87_07280 [Bacteroidota bacterium]
MRAYHFITLFALLTVHSFQQDYLPRLRISEETQTEEWLRFESQLKDGQVYLRWQTKLDKRPRGFEIERSRDGQTFEAVGKVSGKTKNKKQQYRYRDVFPSPGTLFYRLRLVDATGESTYSEVKELSNPATPSEAFSFKNYSSAFTVYFPVQTEGKTGLRLLDPTGAVVHEENLAEGLQSWGMLWEDRHTSDEYLLQIVLRGKTYYHTISRRDS